MRWVLPVAVYEESVPEQMPKHVSVWTARHHRDPAQHSYNNTLFTTMIITIVVVTTIAIRLTCHAARGHGCVGGSHRLLGRSASRSSKFLSKALAP